MFEDIKKVHIIGIGGIGISAVAKLLYHNGKEVTGSDVNASSITDEVEELGIKVSIGHMPDQVPEGCDLVIYSSAVPDDNPERVVATEQGIRQINYPEFLGELTNEYRTIAITGTHGKSSTTAMTGLIFEAAGLDPTVIVGSKVATFPDGNLRLGKSDILIVEACEHEAHMLNIKPEQAVITNVEREHLDYYRDLDHIKESFQKFINGTKEKVIINADDVNSKNFKADQVISFGYEFGDYRVQSHNVGDGVQSFDVTKSGKALGSVKLYIPGKYNVMNAMAAITVATEFGIDFSDCQKALNDYPGAWRRFETVGSWHGAKIISDYAHHPTAIKATLVATREFFPDKKVILVYQPHHHVRTRELFDDFIPAFDECDELILAEIYRVAGRESDEYQDVSSRELVEAVQARDEGKGRRREVVFSADLNSVEDEVRNRAKDGDIVIFMGAGDIDEVARGLGD